MAHVRYSATATLLPDGRVLIVGGVDNNAQGERTAEVYDPARGTFKAAGSMSAGRSGHTATLLLDGTVLITGGVNDGGALNKAERWQP